MENFKLNLQEAQGFIRTAERNMFSGKNQEAVELLNKADGLYAELAKENPDDFQVKSLFTKIEKIRKDLEKKGVKTREGGKEELPFEVNAQLQRIRESLTNKNLEYATREMNNFYSKYAGPYTDLPEVKELRNLIDSLEKDEKNKQAQLDAEKTANAEMQAENQEFSNQWMNKFREIGYFDGTPHNVFDLSAHITACRKAVAVVNDYMKVENSFEPEPQLQSLVEDVKRRVESFISNYVQTTNEMAAEIKNRIQQHIQQLQNDTAWKNDELIMPMFTGQAEMKELLNGIEEMREVCVENMQAFNDMMSTYTILQDLNTDRRKERTSRVRMKPEVMSPDEGKLIKECAIEVLLKKNQGAEILKSAVVKQWDEKFEEGWEDNTRSKWIKRNFRESHVQIAARLTSGDVHLFHMYIEQTIGQEHMRSHIIYDEMMKPENV
jgi:hypothetical protein